MAAILRKLALGAALTLAVTAQAAPIKYLINESSGNASVSGYIETDGVIGQVAGSDILDWSLLLNDGSSSDPLNPLGKLTLNAANSTHGSHLPGYYFYATATQLQFNFSGNFGGVLFQTPHTGSNGPFVAFDSAIGGEGWGYSSLNWWVGGAKFIELDKTGTTPIAVAVPEPSSWALLVGGLGVLAWSTRRRNA